MTNKITIAAASLTITLLVLCGGNSVVPVEEPRPATPVENHLLPYFPPIIAQSGQSCAHASGIGYVVTYELNALRNSPADDPARRYTYFSTFNFSNNGNEQFGSVEMLVDAWQMVQSNGVISEFDFGAIEPRSTKWVDGYDRYYRGMKNRIEDIDSLSFQSEGSFEFFRQFLRDHATGAHAGGIFIIKVIAVGIQDAIVTSGPHKGRYIIRALGSDSTIGKHAVTVTGYDDEVALDMNRDGAITSAIDINNDGKVTMEDNEKGAFICANTWGYASGDMGFMYIPYCLFVKPFTEGGLLTPYGYYITVREHTPARTFRIRLGHQKRNALSLTVGCSNDSAAATPSVMRLVKQFNFAGGPLPMRGEMEPDSIEIGIDVSDLADSLKNSSPAAYYLSIDAHDSTGRCSAFSLYDYTAASTKIYTCESIPRNLAKGKNILRISIPPQF